MKKYSFPCTNPSTKKYKIPLSKEKHQAYIVYGGPRWPTSALRIPERTPNSKSWLQILKGHSKF